MFAQDPDDEARSNPDIDVMEIFNSLEPGDVSSGYICEGCGLAVIGKSTTGELQVMRIYPDDAKEEHSSWEKY